MHRPALMVSLAITLAACAVPPQPSAAPASASDPGCPSMRLEDQCFTPGGDCTGMIVKWVDRAQTQILVQAYSFTDPSIADALVHARQRGIDVRVVLDKSQPHARGGKMATLVDAGIPVQIERMPGIAHNKIIIIDGRYVETGSFNYTQSAQNRNAENAIVVSGCGVREYIDNWRANAVRASAPGRETSDDGAEEP